MHTAVLLLHAAAGTAGLALGPPALRWRSAASAYQLALALVTGSAVLLVAFDPPRLWWLLPFAVGTQAAALAGRRARRSRPWRVRLFGGSYVSLVTAVLVVSRGGVLAWVLPSLIGVLIVETAAARVTVRSPADVASAGHRRAASDVGPAR